VISGQFVSGSTDRIVFVDDSGVRQTYPTRDVQSLDFNNFMTRATGAANRERADGRRHVWNTLPAGTDISVRTDERIDATEPVAGRTYTATIQQDIAGPSGIVMIPRGSQANLIVSRVNEGGTFTSGNLVLDLDSIVVNGHRYDVSTEDLQRGNNQGIGANRRTGEMVGGGAALGTLLGAIAGGGKGAAIGAIAGAVTGGGVQVLTKGKEIRVPAETVLNFRLDQPLPLREAN